MTGTRVTDRVVRFWTQLSSEDRGALGIMAGFGTPLLGICAARGGGFDGLGELVGTAVDAGPVIGGIALAGAAVAALAWLGTGASSSRGREIVVHHEAGEYGIAARHEAGHIAMAEQVGCRVTGARIYPDGSGWTSYYTPMDIGPVELGAIDVAGEVASGTASGCGSDHRAFNRMLGGVGMFNRGYVKRKSYSIARRHVGPGLLGGAGRVGRYERRLLARGRL